MGMGQTILPLDHRFVGHRLSPIPTPALFGRVGTFDPSPPQPSPCKGNYMGEKPKKSLLFGRDRPAGEAAYFFLRGFVFFFVNSSRVFTGMASIRRATSSSDIGRSGESFFSADFMAGRLFL